MKCSAAAGASQGESIAVNEDLQLPVASFRHRGTHVPPSTWVVLLVESCFSHLGLIYESALGEGVKKGGSVPFLPAVGTSPTLQALLEVPGSRGAADAMGAAMWPREGWRCKLSGASV